MAQTRIKITQLDTLSGNLTKEHRKYSKFSTSLFNVVELSLGVLHKQCIVTKMITNFESYHCSSLISGTNENWER